MIKNKNRKRNKNKNRRRKVVVSPITHYDPKFVKKIRESEKDVEEGRVITVNLNELWK